MVEAWKPERCCWEMLITALMECYGNLQYSIKELEPLFLHEINKIKSTINFFIHVEVIETVTIYIVKTNENLNAKVLLTI